MIRGRLESVDVDELRDLLNFLAAEAVDDAALSFVLFEEADQLLLGFFLGPYLVVQIFSVEGGDENIRLFHLKVLLDIELNLWGRRGCECDHRKVSQLPDHCFDLAILRPEVMTPFGNAMSF